MGLVDQLVDPPSLEAAAVEAAASLAAGKLKPKRKPKSLMNWLIEDTPPGRAIVWNQVVVWCSFIRSLDYVRGGFCTGLRCVSLRGRRGGDSGVICAPGTVAFVGSFYICCRLSNFDE